MTLNLALVGCGGMGLRHTHGLIELRKHFDSFRLTAVCDRNLRAAEHLADVAYRELGERPVVSDDFARLLAAENSLDAVDIVTETNSHHTLAEAAFRAGLHVIVEKPMGVTLKACRSMRDAAAAADKTLAVAENYRRDPLCRLGKALLDSGVIGEPRLLMDSFIGGGDTLRHNTSWRALKSWGGGLVFEEGVHNADLLHYYLGDTDHVFAETDLFEKALRRKGMQPEVEVFYRHRADTVHPGADSVEADAVDTGVAVVRFRSGAIGQLTMSKASPVPQRSVTTLYGALGQMRMAAARTGVGPTVLLEGGDPLRGDDLLDLAPDLKLDDATAPYFGGSQPIASYDMSFQEIDRALLAVELQDFAESIRTGRRPEVDYEAGMKAVALVYGILESGQTGAPVKVGDVMDGTVAEYQRPIDREVGV